MPNTAEIRQHQRPINVFIACAGALLAAIAIDQMHVDGRSLLAIVVIGSLLVAMALAEAAAFLLLGKLRHVRYPDKLWIMLFVGLALGWLATNE